MTTSYDRRLAALEHRHNPAPLPPIRIVRMIVNPDREVEAAYLCGQHFNRAEGESVDELRQRAMRAVGYGEG